MQTHSADGLQRQRCSSRTGHRGPNRSHSGPKHSGHCAHRPLARDGKQMAELGGDALQESKGRHEQVEGTPTSFLHDPLQLSWGNGGRTAVTVGPTSPGIAGGSAGGDASSGQDASPVRWEFFVSRH